MIDKNSNEKSVSEVNKEKFEKFKKDLLNLGYKSLSFNDFYKEYKDVGCHETSLGTLLCYSKLLLKLQTERVLLYKDFIVFNQRGLRILLFKSQNITLELKEYFKDNLLNRFLTQIVDTNRDLFNKEERLFYKGRLRRLRRNEIVTDLNKLFDRTLYRSRKYNKKITQALNLKNRVELVDVTLENFDKVENLNTTWCKEKVKNGVHLMSFPQTRYPYTSKKLLLEKEYLEGYNKLIYIDGELYGFTNYSFSKNVVNGKKIAYEMSYVTTWQLGRVKIDNSLLRTYILSQIKNLGYDLVNSGYQLNKKLKKFKSMCGEGVTKSFTYNYSMVTEETIERNRLKALKEK